MNYEWILFDIDNTLLDFSKASKQSFYTTLENNGISCTPEIHNVYRAINAKVWEDFESKKITALTLRSLRFKKFFEAINQFPCTPEAFSVQYLSHLVECSESYNGVIPLLESLKGQYKMSIITNGLKEVQRPRLQKLKMEGYFDSIVVSDEIGVAKPDHDFFAHTYATLDNPPTKDKILVVGDSLKSDILGGNNFGVKTCWVNPQGKDHEGIVPDYQVNNVLELTNLLG